MVQTILISIKIEKLPLLAFIISRTHPFTVLSTTHYRATESITGLHPAEKIITDWQLTSNIINHVTTTTNGTLIRVLKWKCGTNYQIQHKWQSSSYIKYYKICVSTYAEAFRKLFNFPTRNKKNKKKEFVLVPSDGL